jgi:heterodisulfide reductase subunit A
MKKRIGVYICHCGGNISDYVDVVQVKEQVQKEEGIVVSKNIMFACADSSQNEIVNDIKEQNLDAIVIASCSPKLHLHTFRNVAIRAGINEYNYVQVNIREQCSWAHSNTPKEATVKAIGLVRGGILRASHSEALSNISISSQKSVVVIGAGVSGMRAAIELAKMGNKVFLLEKDYHVGGRISQIGNLFVSDQNGKEIISRLYKEIKSLNNITLFTGANIYVVSGNLGNFHLSVKLSPGCIKNDCKEEKNIKLRAGAILVTTGFDSYQPQENEYGYSTINNVITLPEFKSLIENCNEDLIHNKNKIKTIVYIYCVGNRQKKGENKYCSRYCCTSAIHTSLLTKKKFKELNSYHLYRDIRTYGKQELLFEESSTQGDIYFKFNENKPPQIEQQGNKTIVKTKDLLTNKTEFEIEADLVVLVTAMVPRSDSKQIAEKLKIPIGTDKFYNEIHPKLRPVETVINGIYLGGSCQGPKNVSESVKSSLSAAAKINALIKKETIELEPIIARINSNDCVWCGKCMDVCDYEAIVKTEIENKVIATVNEAVCSGCGFCAPVCPNNAIEIAQFTDKEIMSMIDGFMAEVELNTVDFNKDVKSVKPKKGMRKLPGIWKKIASIIREEAKTIPEISKELNIESDSITYNLMTMNKYGMVEITGLDDDDEYYYYKMN